MRVARDPGVAVDVSFEEERTIEGVDVHATVDGPRRRAVDRLELLARPSPGRRGRRRRRRARAMRLRAGDEREITFALRCTRWGVFDLGDVDVRARDPFRLVVWETDTSDATT